MRLETGIGALSNPITCCGKRDVCRSRPWASFLKHSVRLICGSVKLFSRLSAQEVASDLFDMNPNIKDRSLLTSIGEKMRDINPDVWVNYVIKQTEGIEFPRV